tara:strand:- start:77300 stop:79978 length:2679 start_codon:yes stop_codon:yes gene_type:complete
VEDRKAKYYPPSWATKWFLWFCHADFAEDILGDLEEEYQFHEPAANKLMADLWFVRQVAGMMRPSLFKPFLPFLKLNNKLDMIKNYIKIGLRNLTKYKVSTAINLLGLSTGMAAFILIALFVKDELSYDRNHEHADEIFRITIKNFSGDGETLSRHWAFASAGHGPRIKEDFPQVTHATRFFPWAFPDVIYGDKRLPGEQVVFADPDVFDIFTFPFLQGNKESAFTNETSMVISEDAAIRIFGNDWREQDIVGKSVKIEARGAGLSLQITGVMENMPRQQHFHFDYLAPFAIYENVVNNPDVTNNVTGNYNYLTYVRLSDAAGAPAVEAGGSAFFDKHIADIRGVKAHNYYGLVLQPLTDIHLTSNISGEIENNGSMSQVVIFSVIGMLLIVVACINYMNLATSRYTRRMKEIGVRKSIGASRGSLISQFLTESVILTLISFPLAVGLATIALPSVNDFMDKQLTINFLQDFQLFLTVFGLLALVAMLAGIYPAIYLSGLDTIRSLKGESTFKTGKINFRTVLVTFQYVVTIAIIFSLAVLDAQMGFIFNSDPGFDKESVLDVSLSNDIYPKKDAFRNELLANQNITHASFVSRIPTGNLLDSQGASIFLGDSLTPVNFRLPYIVADENFITTYGIEMAAGNDFERYMDSDSIGYFIVNEAAVKAMGLASAEGAINRSMNYGGTDGKIIGVMKDFHFESLHSEIGPMIMVKNDNYRRISLKINPVNLSETIAFVEQTWAKFDQKNTINYNFVDESFENQYQGEERLSTMFKAFAVLAVLISCLGMLGMVTFIVERKTKEIGIRKVLGAKSPHIVWLVSQNFIWLISVAALVALPIGYYFMSDWLDTFAYQVTISPVLFVVPIVAVIMITLLTILYRTIKAVYINPVKYLRSE